MQSMTEMLPGHITIEQGILLAQAATEVRADRVQPGQWVEIHDEWGLCTSSESISPVGSTWGIDTEIAPRGGYAISASKKLRVAPAGALVDAAEANRIMAERQRMVAPNAIAAKLAELHKEGHRSNWALFDRRGTFLGTARPTDSPYAHDRSLDVPIRIRVLYAEETPWTAEQIAAELDNAGPAALDGSGEPVTIEHDWWTEQWRTRTA